MLIKHDFEVDQPIEKVWEFCSDIPNVASCLPGATLTDEVGQDQYEGNVAIRLAETDSPYLAPVPHRGRTNEPAYVPLVGAAVAAVKGVAVEEIADSTWATATRA